MDGCIDMYIYIYGYNYYNYYNDYKYYKYYND